MRSKKDRLKKLDLILRKMSEDVTYMKRPPEITKDAGFNVDTAESFFLINMLKEREFVYRVGTKDDFYSITPNGLIFIEDIGFRKQNWLNKVKDFPKDYWWAISFITFIIGLFSPIIQKSIEQKILQQSNQLQQEPQVNADTTQNHKMIRDTSH